MSKMVYDRQRVLWQFEDLQRLEAEGQATLLSDHGIWIVKVDGGQVAVRPEQILVSPRTPPDPPAEPPRSTDDDLLAKFGVKR